MCGNYQSRDSKKDDPKKKKNRKIDQNQLPKLIYKKKRKTVK